MNVIHTIGRRKTAIARVYLSEGKGEVTINKKALQAYFPTATHQYKINQPFRRQRIICRRLKSTQRVYKHSCS